MKTAIVIAFLMATAATATEQPTPQQIAQARADWIVSNHYHWHPPYTVGTGPQFWLWRHARFEGLGFGRPGAQWKRMGTCRPRYRMALVADAYASNNRMSVRVRLWR